MKLLSIAGARPNFMKLAAIAKAVDGYNRLRSGDDEAIEHLIVHTGQHYDEKMSKSFFVDLGIPNPDINLEVGSSSHAVQTAEIMRRFEPVLLAEQPDVLLVVGDVNSTIACTLVAAKVEYPASAGRKRPLIVHVEAGLRSFDMDMPEEVNRILTDRLSDLLFVTEESGLVNLREEGVDASRIHFVGNVMIDTLRHHLPKARLSDVHDRFHIPDRYATVTLHRPSNVDYPETLNQVLETLTRISDTLPLIFPVHPRTRQRIEEFGLSELLNWRYYPGGEDERLQSGERSRVYALPPLGYLDFLSLVSKSVVVITDSGGIQEETTYLKVPCITLRNNTERPVTVAVGSNYLLGSRYDEVVAQVAAIVRGDGKQSEVPDLWDGKAGERIVEVLAARGT